MKKQNRDNGGKEIVWPWQYNGSQPYEWHAIDYWMKKNHGPAVPQETRKQMDFNKIEERFKE